MHNICRSRYSILMCYVMRHETVPCSIINIINSTIFCIFSIKFAFCPCEIMMINSMNSYDCYECILLLSVSIFSKPRNELMECSSAIRLNGWKCTMTVCVVSPLRLSRTKKKNGSNCDCSVYNVFFIFKCARETTRKRNSILHIECFGGGCAFGHTPTSCDAPSHHMPWNSFTIHHSHTTIDISVRNSEKLYSKILNRHIFNVHQFFWCILSLSTHQPDLRPSRSTQPIPHIEHYRKAHANGKPEYYIAHWIPHDFACVSISCTDIKRETIAQRGI